LNEWQWPINGLFAGYIQARSLLNIGDFINYSPIQIEQSSTITITKPTPQISMPLIPQSFWFVSIISST
ncbi:22834_t:CDS:1, partial [Rhizophagus irregularis]